MKKTILFVFSFLFPAFTFAQASLEISVLDSLNNPIVGHPLTVSNAQIGYKKQVLSSEKGKVRLSGLSTSGLYQVQAADGQFYGGQSVRNIALISDKVTSISLVLREKTTALQSVTVVAGNYRSINTVNAEVASELSVQELQSLPVEGRDMTRALYRLPNITQATGFFPEAPNVAINGANSLYTDYQIDGLDNNENFLGGQRFAMPLGFTKNITALTNNFSAEHGLTSNGIINLTTQSGTNQISGEAFYVTRPGPSLDAPSKFAQRDLSGNQVKDGFMRQQGGFALGGAITKDKIFYFLNAEHTTDVKDNLLNVPQLGINQTVRGRNQFSYLSGKLDQNWSDRFRSSLRVNVGLVGIERQGGGLDGGITFPSAGNTQDRNAVNIALKNTYNGEKFTYEGNYLFGKFDWNYATPTENTNPNVFVLDPTGVGLAALGHPGYVFHDIEKTHVLQQKLTLIKNDHLIKTGFQIKSSNFELFGGGNPNGGYTVQLNQAQLNQLKASGIGINLAPKDIPADVNVLGYSVELRPASFQKTQNILSFYVEDQWTVSSKLNVNVGLRYDYDNLSKGANTTGDLNNLAPRLSANYKLNDVSSIRAGYGIYYDKILYAIYSDALQFNSTAADYKKQLQALIAKGVLPTGTDVNTLVNEGNLSASATNVAYLKGTPAAQLQGQRATVFQHELRILNPDGYQNPYSHQAMIGYQHKLNERTSFYVDAMHNRSYNLFRLRNLNAPAAYPINASNVVVRSTAAADATRPIPIYSDAQGNYALINGEKVRGAARNVVVTEAKGRSNYSALNFTFQRDKGQDPIAFRLMYTLSSLKNDTEDINFRAMDGNDFAAEWGASINDRTHLLNGIFSYYVGQNLNVTLTALLQSGQPINRIPDGSRYGTTDLNGDGRSFGDAYVGNSDRAPGVSRNADRLPWAKTFDLSALYKLKLGQHGIEIGAQVFNALNAENLSGYANNATQSNQIQVGAIGSDIVKRNAAPPRQFQFSARFLF